MLGRPGRRGGAPLMAAPLSSDDYPDAHTGFRIALLEEGDALARAAGSATSGADEPRASRAPSEPPIEIQPLAGDDADRLVSRMAPIAAQDADELDFAVRDKTLPAPRAGAVVNHEFPPAKDRERPTDLVDTSDDLKVLRYMPQGPIEQAPHISVTFSHPMVVLSTVEQVAAQEVPVQLTPRPEGQFEWLGTRTVMFKPAFRFPMATAYSVVIPEGTKALNGATLKERVAFQFVTPPPKLVSASPSPHQTVSRRPVMFVEFDQLVNKRALVSRIMVRAGSRFFSVREATDEELADTANNAPEVRAAILRATTGRWVAFALKDGTSLDYDAQCTVSIPAGLPSDEGPETTTTEITFEFRTYGPMQVVDPDPSIKHYPFEAFSIRFTNVIDAEEFDEERDLVIEPPIEDLRVVASGTALSIHGRTKGRTTYNVTIKETVKDTYGQFLLDEKTLTFNVLPPLKSLYAFRQGFMTLDPATPIDRLLFSLLAVNVAEIDVTLFQVTAEEYKLSPWGHTPAFHFDYQTRSPDVVSIGKRIVHKKMATNCREDEPTLVEIPIAEALAHREEGLGHVLVVVTSSETFEHGQPPLITAWLQVTKLAFQILSESDSSEAELIIDSLETGAPIAGAVVPGADSPSNEHGSIRILRAPTEYVVRFGNDSVILPPHLVQGQPFYQYRQALYHTVDDRKMYKPKEEVHIKGWLRVQRFRNKPFHEIELPSGRDLCITYTVSDARGQVFHEGTTQASASWGSFHVAFTIPDNVNLGTASVSFRAEDLAHTHHFDIQEFRRPEYSVSAHAEGTMHVTDGAPAVVEVSAQYFAGGAIENAEVAWSVSTTSSSYSPPGWLDYRFGQYTPWYYSWCGGSSSTHASVTKQFSSTTDSSGKHRLAVVSTGVDTPPTPVTIKAEAAVTDINRQRQVTSASFIVHPSSIYVGAKNSASLIEPEGPLPLSVIVADIDGQPVAGRKVTITLTRSDDKYRKGKWHTETITDREVEVLSGHEPIELDPLALSPLRGGSHNVLLQVTDEQGRVNQTKLNLWVAGGLRETAGGTQVNQETVLLIADKENYEPGDVATIVVQPPFLPFEGRYVLRCNKIVDTQRFTISAEQRTFAIKVHIREEFIPAVSLHVSGVGATHRTNPQGRPLEGAPLRPAYAIGTLSISVPELAHQLQVTATPEHQSTTPGSATSVLVQVNDKQGRAVRGAEVAVVVVDEAVLSLTGYEITSPLGAFHPRYWSHQPYQTSRSQVYILNWQDIALTRPPEPISPRGGMFFSRRCCCKCCCAPAACCCAYSCQSVAPECSMADCCNSMDPFGGAPADSDKPIAVRSNFNPLATFEPSAVTDASGSATVKFTLPDNLTRYRVWAVAVHEVQHFGIADSSITAQHPLMVRPSAPRFLNFGDQALVPVVVQNNSPLDSEVRIAMRAHNLVVAPEGRGFKAVIPAGRRAEFRFPVTTHRVGTARLQVAVSGAGFSDAAEVSLPVWTPATSEAFATYGELDAGVAVQPIAAPENVFPQFGGLEISSSSTALHALTDAFLYLWQYPYECAEQSASRAISIVALRDVLSAFRVASLPSRAEMNDAVNKLLKKVARLQHSDGGFGMWSSNTDSAPFATVHVANMLARVREKAQQNNDHQYEFDAAVLDRALGYLRDIRRHIQAQPYKWSPLQAHSLEAYALFVRSLAGDGGVLQAAEDLWKHAGGIHGVSLEALGWFLMATQGKSSHNDEIHTFLRSRVNETAETANFVSSYGEANDGTFLLLHSERRTDGVLLEALVRTTPEDTLIVKLVKGLLAHRKRGHWGNTQENCHILLALDQYFNVFEREVPNFTARVWMGDTFAGEQSFKGRSTERHVINIPLRVVLDELAQGEAKPLAIERTGDAGRLYYRIGMSYAPRDLSLPPLDRGFVVLRTYEAIGDEAQVRKDEHGVWHIKAGARVRVRLSMATQTRRYHVALVDKLPAGLEPLNPALKTTGSIPADPNDTSGSRPWWRSVWYEHQNMRDERVEAFASLLWEGVHTYSYVAQATTPGRFMVPPAQAEEMYSPEVFGRSGYDHAIIE